MIRRIHCDGGKEIVEDGWESVTPPKREPKKEETFKQPDKKEIGAFADICMTISNAADTLNMPCEAADRLYNLAVDLFDESFDTEE